MPFADILKRRKPSEDRNQPLPTKDKQSPVKKISETRLPLEGIENLDVVDNVQHDGIQLVTCLDDILIRNIGLGYLIQFLESKNQDALIKFWMDVSSFITVSRGQTYTFTDNHVRDCYIVSSFIYFYE